MSGAVYLSIMWMVFAGPTVALAGFVVGFLVTPMRSLSSSGQVSKAIGWALLIAAGGVLAFTWYRRGSIPPSGGLMGLLGAVGGYLIGRGGDSRSPPPT